MFLEVGLLIQETERARMKRILNYKYMILFGIIAFITMFMVFYVYINYAYEMPSRYENVNYDETDLTREEIEKIRNNNFLQNFLSLKEGFSFDESYSRYCAVKTRIIPIVVISIFFLYSSIKCNLVKYNIGRNNKFAKENNKLKRRIALIPALFSLIIVFALIVIGLLSNKNNFLTYFKFLYNHNDIINGLLVAGLFGLVVKDNASISGAECGCQAEIGTACAMGAALVATVKHLNNDQIERAAEIALEHHLGLTCDPILGYVQIPCIERNAVAALRAIESCSLAELFGESQSKISFDLVVETMKQTGIDLKYEYRETSAGGLAKNYIK